MSDFDWIFDFVVSSEGGFTDNPADPGNWTGGKVGAGLCRGTKFGISAAAHSDLNIKSLTLDEAKALYQREYWDRVDGDRLPDSIALLVFDAAINNGIGRSVRWLQQAVLVAQDGVIGPRTLQAIDHVVARPGGSMELGAELLAQRLTFMTALATWKSFGLGWARRLFRLQYASLEAASNGRR
jgi:lysozyme family protein